MKQKAKFKYYIEFDPNKGKIIIHGNYNFLIHDIIYIIETFNEIDYYTKNKYSLEIVLGHFFKNTTEVVHKMIELIKDHLTHFELENFEIKYHPTIDK